ncbi:hypothetical protein Ddye_006347 [Dipteronia dyeriana]|uniref:DUF4283 domain-containing protein n=1 Tax=Dipteronia dyeriana TaxID=168575 RepID=A0AAE0CQL0_9ROSI|nr:hypothetical protein Ddye_006347 [Dipteronia dyeriana]
MPIWVRLSKLPIEWMVFDLFWSISGMLGKMCKVDPITENQARGRFARICVEIDITKPLLGSLSVDDRSIRVEYESLGLICFKCGRYEHGKENCREGVVDPIQEEDTCDIQTNTDNEKTPYGPWLLVTYGKQGNRNFKGKVGKNGNGSASSVVRNGNTKHGTEGSSKSGIDGTPKRVEGDKNNVKNGRFTKYTEENANTLGNSTSGSRFEILNKKMEVSMGIESLQFIASPSCSKLKEKSDTMNVMQNDNNFDDVASTLEEAMAVISE